MENDNPNNNGEIETNDKIKTESSEEDENKKKLLYGLEDRPNWVLTILLGFQHYLMMVGGSLSVPYLLIPLMCIPNSNLEEVKAKIISTLLFCSGLITLSQTIFGTRLPIIQGGSFSFLIPSIAILTSRPCANPNGEENWQERICEIAGAIIIASLFQIIVGFFGIAGLLIRYITPLTIAPAISMMGLSLFGFASSEGSSNWLITILTVILIVTFSQYIPHLQVPIPYFGIKQKRIKILRYPIFQIFPVSLSIFIMWILCAILTPLNAFSEKSEARVDNNLIISQAAWINLPYPFQWGWPIFTAGPILGMLMGSLAGIIESFGDYITCAKILGIKKPPPHAVNRGIFIEGLGCLLCGIMGTGDGTTSYSENIGALSVTKVGARRVIQAAAILMIGFSFFGKFGALIVSIPKPIVAGVFYSLFSIIIGVGFSNLKKVDINSSRNIFILGFSMLFPLSISQWASSTVGKASLKELSPYIGAGITQVIQILLSTSMFIAGLLGFFLDNTIPGTNSERGISKELEDFADELESLKSYNIPFLMNIFERFTFFHYFPISPTFKKEKLTGIFRRKKKNTTAPEDNNTSLKMFTNKQPNP